MYIFSGDGFVFLADDLKSYFRDKEIINYHDMLPVGVKAALKAKYPERVL